MDERPVSAILKDMTSGFSALIRSEIRLARAEMAQSARFATKDMIYAGVFGGIAYFGALGLLAFAIIGLGELLGDNYWLSAVIIGGALTIVGGGIAFYFIRRITADAKIKRVQQNLQDDQQMVRERVREVAQAARETPRERVSA